MRLRFLLDEQISPRVATSAAKAGLDVAAVSGSDLAGMDDESLLRESVKQKRILVTYNIGDFVVILQKLIREGTDIPGIVFVDAKTISTAQFGRLARALGRLAERIRRNEVDPAGGIFLTGKRRR